MSGLESGGINLQSVRHDEGKRIAHLRGHTSAISVLNVAVDEKSFLSGSWDKTVLDWDLNSGKTIRSFEGSGGQISALETRPLSSLPVPENSDAMQEIVRSVSADDAQRPRTNGILPNGVGHDGTSNAQDGDRAINGNAGTPVDSLFGGNDADSLFGDTDNMTAPSGAFDDDDNDFSRAIASGLQEQEQDQAQERRTPDAEGDIDMPDPLETSTIPLVNGDTARLPSPKADAQELHTDHLQDPTSSSSAISNDFQAASEILRNHQPEQRDAVNPSESPPASDSTFLAASFDGSLRIWDKRQKAPIAKITPHNVPPWCMNACWSPDGNFIYAGRRNGTVDEYSLHKGLRVPTRNFKLPNNSGAVSAVRAMPNGRHLIW